MINDPKELAEEIFRASLAAVDPYRAVMAQRDVLLAAYRDGGYSRILAVGFGKASPAMAEALEEIAGRQIDDGVIVTKYGHLGGRTFRKIRAFEAAHPVPDENGLRAAQEILRLLEGAGEDTLVVCLISGGGSALLVSPAEGLTLQDKQGVTSALLRAGADINELNSVRKHLSRVKGGRLARAACPAGVVSLIISDVIGDPPDVIASGPTAPDGSTFADAVGVIEKYGLHVPQRVAELLRKGVEGQLEDTPKEDDEAFSRVRNIIVGSNRMALMAAKDKAEALGIEAEVLTDSLSGEARDAALWLSEVARRVRQRPLCLIAGGETTVTVRGRGKGGRNTELALWFAKEIEGRDGITLLAAGTDGTDGPTDAAGAIVDGNTARAAAASGLSPGDYLANNDSYTFFEQAGGLLITGPTGTNVMDIDIMVLS